MVQEHLHRCLIQVQQLMLKHFIYSFSNECHTDNYSASGTYLHGRIW
jgi:hypothetical protein